MSFSICSEITNPTLQQIQETFVSLGVALNYQRCLRTCRFLTLEIFEFTLIKYSLFLLKLTFTLAVFYQTYLFLQKFSLSYFIQYGPTYFINLYVVVGLFSQSFLTNFVSQLERNMPQKSFDNIGVITKKKLEPTLLYITVYMMMAVAVSSITAVSILIPTPDDTNIIYIYRIQADFFPAWQHSSKFIAQTIMITVSSYIAGAIPAFYVMYVFAIINLQVHCYLDHLKNINKELDSLEIQKKLVKCVKYHIFINSNIRGMFDKIQIFVLTFEISGCLLMTSTVVFYFSYEGFLEDQYFRVVDLIVLAFFTLAAMVAAGQAFEDFSSNCFDQLTQVTWYHWNEENKRTCLILLTNSLKKLKIKYSENISLNYNLGIQVVRVFLSAISIMYKLKNSHIK